MLTPEKKVLKILFASGAMSGGGAERVVSLLGNEFISHGIDVSILVVRGESSYKLDDKVRLIPVYQDAEITSSLINKVLRRLNYLPRLIACIRKAKPDVLIPVHGGGWNGLFVLFAKFLGVKVVAAEHINYTVGRYGMRRWLERRVIYKMADAVTVLTRFDFEYYKKFIKNLIILPNPISFRSVSGISNKEKIILAAGRLDNWSHKGFDNLLKVFSVVSGNHPDWRLQLAGAGAEGKEYLTQLAAELHVNDKVDFLGFKKEIDQVMRSASIFVLSSRFEGFGMVLAEAMSQRCACISFDCPAGPSEIITNGVDGVLVENQNNQAMAIELERLMNDRALRQRLAGAGLINVDKFSMEVISAKWFNLFKKLGLAP